MQSTLSPRIAPSAGRRSVMNPCRKAHRNYSLFPIHYSLSTRPARRHTAPRHSPPHFPGTPENCSPQGRGNQFSGDPRWLSGYAGTFYPRTVLPRRNLTPRQSRPTSREHQRIAPRRGALTSWAWFLSRLRACEFGMSADFERKLLPAGAGGFPISWGYDKISAGAVGARFYTNKSGAKENHLCRELWVWPGRPLQNMI